MGSLPLFLLLASALLSLGITSQSRAIWPRMSLGFLTGGAYILSAIHLEAALNGVLLAISITYVSFILRWGKCSAVQGRRYLGPSLFAVFVCVLVAFRPSLLEYPVDHLNYWQRVIDAFGVGRADVLACELGNFLEYKSVCSIWLKLAAATNIPESWYLSGLYVRMIHFGELLVLALSLLRLWSLQRIKPIAAACMVAVVFVGTGYLYNLFVINHALQGSILAAALFVECSGVLCALFARLRSNQTVSSRVSTIVAWYSSASVYLLLLLKLHGLFSLLTLVWILVVPVSLPILLPALFGVLPHRAIWEFYSVALIGTIALFIFKNSLSVPVSPNFSGVVIRWSDSLGLASYGEYGLVSFIPRTSDTRPEALAVLSLLVSVAFLIAAFRDRQFLSGSINSGLNIPLNHSDKSKTNDFALLSSVYVASILVVYLLPPFSNLFLKLNPEYSSHMRFMWGACLVSPLPCILFSGERHLKSLLFVGSLILIVVVFVPLQFVEGQRKQLFFSKVRHLILPTPSWADPSHVASILIPALRASTLLGHSMDRVTVAADPIIRTALYPFGVVGDPEILLGEERISHYEELSNHYLSKRSALRYQNSFLDSHRLPSVIIQQKARECFYSVYADMYAYDPCIASGVAGFAVNRWSAERLKSLGYNLVWESGAYGFRIWRHSAVGR